MKNKIFKNYFIIMYSLVKKMADCCYSYQFNYLGINYSWL